MPGDRLQGQGGGQLPAGDRIALQPNPGEGAQRQCDGEFADRAVGAQESAERDGRHEVDVLDWLGLGQRKIEGQRVVTQTQPDGGEVGIGRPALPEPAGADQRLESARVGMQPEQ